MVKRRRAKVLAAAMLATACGGVTLTARAGAESEPPPSIPPAHPLTITISPPDGHAIPLHDLAGPFGLRIEPGPGWLDLPGATQLALEPPPGPFPPVPPRIGPEPLAATGADAAPPGAQPEALDATDPGTSASEPEPEVVTQNEPGPTTPPPAVTVDDGTDGASSTNEEDGPSEAALASLRACESGGDYTIVSYGGWYRGAYQFDQETWDSVASRWRPALLGVDPAQASPADQDAMARALYAERGWAPWPVCGLGL